MTLPVALPPDEDTDWGPEVRATMRRVNALDVNLLDYAPAGPDGVGDNSGAFASALAAAVARRTRLYVPRMPSSWIIGSPVAIPGDVTIYSDGWGPRLSPPTVKLGDGLNTYAFALGTGTADGNRVVVRDLEIDGNVAAQTGGGIFLANNPVQCLFDAVHFHHAYDAALWLRGQQGPGPYGHHVRVVNSLFDNSAQSPGSGQALRIQAVDEVFVGQTDFENNGGAGVNPCHIWDGSGINSFVHNVFVGGRTAVKFQDCSGSRFVANMVDGLNATALDCSASNLQIVGNHFFGVGNTITPNTAFHIFLQFGSHNAVVGNVFVSGGTTQGLRGFVSLGTSSSYNVIGAGNVFRVEAGVLGAGGVLDWNGSTPAAQSSRVIGNIGVADAA